MIVKDVDLNSDKWLDLVFEGKNQEYGAYYLRKTSSKRHLLALSVVIIPIIVILFLFKFIHFNPSHPAFEYEMKSIELANLDNLGENYRNDALRPEEKPTMKKIIEFTPSMIVENDSIINNLKEELREMRTDSLYASDSIDIVSALSALKEEEAILLRREEQDTTLVDENNRDAEFPGGKVMLIQYIYRNIHYPPEALKQRIQGKVISSFIISEDGSISDITLVQGIYALLDEEALKVLHTLPPWKPAMKDGKAIKTKVIVPIVFKL